MASVVVVVLDTKFTSISASDFWSCFNCICDCYYFWTGKWCYLVIVGQIVLDDMTNECRLVGFLKQLFPVVCILIEYNIIQKAICDLA